MSSTAPNTLQNELRRGTLLALAKIEEAHGKAVMGIYAEAMLEAIALHLHGSAGAEAAYNALQRHADQLAGMRLEQVARQQ